MPTQVTAPQGLPWIGNPSDDVEKLREMLTVATYIRNKLQCSRAFGPSAPRKSQRGNPQISVCGNIADFSAFLNLLTPACSWQEVVLKVLKVSTSVVERGDRAT